MEWRYPGETDAEFQERFDACWRQSIRRVYRITAAEWVVLSSLTRQRWSHFLCDDVEQAEAAVRHRLLTGRRLEVSNQATIHAIAAQSEAMLRAALSVDHEEWVVETILGGADFYRSLVRLSQIGLVHVFRVDQTRWSGPAVLVAVGGSGAEVEAAYRQDQFGPVLERLPDDGEIFGNGGFELP